MEKKIENKTNPNLLDRFRRLSTVKKFALAFGALELVRAIAAPQVMAASNQNFRISAISSRTPDGVHIIKAACLGANADSTLTTETAGINEQGNEYTTRSQNFVAHGANRVVLDLGTFRDGSSVRFEAWCGGSANPEIFYFKDFQALSDKQQP